jgi:hypothetical protein
MGILLAIGGCFAPHFPSPLEEKSVPKETVAFIPITPAQIRMVLRAPESEDSRKAFAGENIIKDRKEAADEINKCLNSLAAGYATLIGPARLDALLNDATLAEKVHVYLNDPGDIDESWKLRGLSEIFKPIGIQKLVRITAILDVANVSSLGGGGGIGVSWDGRVIIRADLISISPLAIRSIGDGEARFWGVIGGVGGLGAAAPFAIGKTFSSAIDQALRKALSGLSNEHLQDMP